MAERGNRANAPGGERPARVGERIRAEVMDMLLRGQLKDPAVRDVVVHEVKVSGDLRYARIFVRSGRPDPKPARQKALMSGLGRATGFVRRALGKRLKLRYTPEITFVWDDTAERAARIEEILEDISNEAPSGD